MLGGGTCAYHMTKSERGAKNKIGEGVDFKYSKRNATKLISGASSGERSAALYTPRDSHSISFRSHTTFYPSPTFRLPFQSFHSPFLFSEGLGEALPFFFLLSLIMLPRAYATTSRSLLLLNNGNKGLLLKEKGVFYPPCRRLKSSSANRTNKAKIGRAHV